MIDPVPVLSDDALREIESRDTTRLRGSTNHLERIVLTVAERDALCATVRALRASEAERVYASSIIKAREALSKSVPETLGEWIVIREALRCLCDEAEELQRCSQTQADSIMECEADNTALREQLAQSQAGYQRATIGLSNLYHVITNERCDDAVALGMATSAVGALLRERDELKDQLAQVTQERDALRNSASIVAFQAHQIDGQIATSLMDNARRQCVKRVREYLTDCRDEETGIIEAVALDLESLIPQLEQP